MREASRQHEGKQSNTTEGIQAQRLNRKPLHRGLVAHALICCGGAPTDEPQPYGRRRAQKGASRTPRFLSDAEHAALLDAGAKSDWAPLYTLVLLAITTGARRGELASLRWADVDIRPLGKP